MVKRERYPTRTILLRTEQQRALAIRTIESAPLDGIDPLELQLREKPVQRTKSANARMWAGVMRDIAEQAYVGGRTYSAEVWHVHCKREYLPEEFDDELCLPGYRKWDYLPNGDRVLIGSTTQLKPKGFALYCEQVYALAGDLGVMLSAAPGEAA